MASLVPFRSPLGVYFRSALGVRDEGERQTPYIDFQITAPSGTNVWLMLGPSSIDRDFEFHHDVLAIREDGVIAGVTGRGTKLTHQQSGNGWYHGLPCDLWGQVLPRSRWGRDFRIVGSSHYLDEPCPVTGIRFNPTLSNIEFVDARHTLLNSLDVRPIKNLIKLWAGGTNNENYLLHLVYPEDFPAMTFENARLAEIKISNPDLEELILDLVQISTLAVGGMMNLKRFILSKSKELDVLHMGGLLKLEEAQISHSKVHSCSFSDCFKLKELSIFDCYPLTNLNISGCLSLETLRIYGVRGWSFLNPINQSPTYGPGKYYEPFVLAANISKLDCSDLISLKNVKIDCCPLLEEIDFSECVSLEEFILKNNESLQTITFKNNEDLIGNFVDDQWIYDEAQDGLYWFSSVPLISYCGNLNSLDFSECPNLKYFKVTNCENFSSIDLSENLEIEAFAITRTALSGITLPSGGKWKRIYLAQNYLTHINLGSLPTTHGFDLNAAHNNMPISEVRRIILAIYNHCVAHPLVRFGYLTLTWSEQWFDSAGNPNGPFLFDDPKLYWPYWELINEMGWSLNITFQPFPWDDNFPP